MITLKSRIIPAIDGTVCVKNKIGYQTDLNVFIVTPNIDKPDGVYYIDKVLGLVLEPDFKIEDFPIAPEFEDFIETEIPVSDIIDLMPFCSTDELRPAQCAVCFSGNYLVATNAHILRALYYQGEAAKREIVIPTTFLKILKQAKIKGNLTYCDTAQNFAVKASDGVIYIGRKVDDRYPNWKAVIPSTKTARITITGDLKPIIAQHDLNYKREGTCKDKRGYRVRAGSIAFNAKYLQTTGIRRWNISDPNRAAISVDKNCLTLLMPVFLKSEGAAIPEIETIETDYPFTTDSVWL